MWLVQRLHVDSTSSTPTAAATTSNGAPVIDNISCEPEHLETHYHAHLTLLRNGKQVKVPAFIGIDFKHQCLYWLHTHDATGIMHIESPDTRTYTLGNWFDVWGKPLSKTQAAGLKGDLKVFVGNRQFTRGPANHRAQAARAHHDRAGQGRRAAPVHLPTRRISSRGP